MDTFATGLRMGESPRWHEGRLWVCDWLAGEVLSFGADGSRRAEARVEGLPFSIDWLPDGRLVMTSPRGVVTSPNLTRYSKSSERFNEIVVDRAGRAWVDKPGSMPGEPRKPGLVAVVLPDGTSHHVADDVWFPNGMASSMKSRWSSPNRTPTASLPGRSPTTARSSTAESGRRWAKGKRPTAFVSMPKVPSGTPRSRTVTASGLPKAGAHSTQWTPTAVASRARSAARTDGHSS
jgi:hypothetical protein